MTWVLMAAAIVAASVDSDLGPETCEIKPHALRSGLANFKKRDFSGLMVQEIGYYDELQRRGMVPLAAVSAGNGGLLAGL
ncbi:hypothetical protein TruAng_008982 [Truncatella angustata]|nr:hypothetical protein TruAng_008982 [Truncatella angustata]